MTPLPWLGRELVVQLTYWLCLPPTLLRPDTPSGRALLATWPPSVAFYPTLNTTLVSKRMLRRYLRRLWPQALLFKITSSLLKLANCSTHGGETWCSCVLHRFHDNNHNKK
ncbi:hypothetical protein GBAR_LOCUS22437, partial [Geodia barretti]